MRARHSRSLNFVVYIVAYADSEGAALTDQYSQTARLITIKVSSSSLLQAPLAMACKIPRTKLGSQGLEVPKQGLGCMGMSAFYGPPKPEEDMIALIHHAVDSGVTFLDTSDVYGPFTNEILLGKALKGIGHKVELATKFGIRYENQQP
eukprot:c23470_g2_i2 orf=2-445(-)